MEIYSAPTVKDLCMRHLKKRLIFTCCRVDVLGPTPSCVSCVCKQEKQSKIEE